MRLQSSLLCDGDTVAFLSKRVPVRYLPAIGRSAYCAGTVFIDRSNPESREKALQETLRMCVESVAVVVFPEGTRSERGDLRAGIDLDETMAWILGVEFLFLERREFFPSHEAAAHYVRTYVAPALVDAG